MSELHLVTGGSGYFGCVLVAELLRRGHRVRVFDLRDVEDRPPEVEFVRGDIRDPDAVRRACGEVAVAHHNVAMVPLARDARAFWSVNRDGARHLLRSCLEAGVSKVVLMSSSAVYGVPPQNPVDETVEPVPGEEYGRAKLAAERVAADYVARGLDVTVIRPRTIMGHGRLGIMQILFEWIRLGRNVPVLGKGDNLYQFIHAQDLAEVCLRAGARRGAATYNVGAADFCTMRETLEATVAHAGTASRVVSLPKAPAVAAARLSALLRLSPLGAYHWLMYGRAMYFDITRVCRELDWRPRYGNIEMFCESYDWYVAHREEILHRRDASHHRSALRPGVLSLASRLLSLWR